MDVKGTMAWQMAVQFLTKIIKHTQGREKRSKTETLRLDSENTGRKTERNRESVAKRLSTPDGLVCLWFFYKSLVRRQRKCPPSHSSPGATEERGNVQACFIAAGYGEREEGALLAHSWGTPQGSSYFCFCFELTPGSTNEVLVRSISAGSLSWARPGNIL